MRSSTLPWTELGRVDVLVNNAAGNFVVRAEDLSPNGWRAVVSIVLDGGFLCARAAAKKMMEHGERRLDPERSRELCVDRRPGDGPLSRGQGGTLGDDEDLGGRVGTTQDQSEHDHSRSDRYRGRRRSALADRRGSGARRRNRSGGAPRHGRRDRLVDHCALLPIRRLHHRGEPDRSTAGTGSSRRATCRHSARPDLPSAAKGAARRRRPLQRL